MENPSDLIPEIKKFSDIFEAYHVTTFQCYRNRKDGTPQKITVEIHDSGNNESPGPGRYSCVAKSEDGTAASGNSSDTIQAALAQVHWYKLDK